jgi:succinoglycan biosynthesis transport protein ExoP
MTFNQALLIVRSQWRIVLSVFGVIVFLALALTLLLPKQYTAVASVVIDSKTDPISATATGNSDQVLAGYVATQTEVIASERVAQRAVKSLKLDQDPALQDAWRSNNNAQGDISIWIARLLLDKRVIVGVAGDNKLQQGNVIDISVKWGDPKVAAAIANAFAQAAIETNIDLKIEPAKLYAKWFDEHSRALRSKLEAAQKRLSDFESSNGIVATDEKLDVENARLAELTTQLVSIESLRQDSQSRQRQTGTDNESLPEVMQSPVIGKLKSDLSDAEAKQADIAGNLGKNHPDFKDAEVQVASLKRRIQLESDKIANSLGSSNQINVRREGDVRQALEVQKKRVLDLKHQHDEAAVLESDVTTAQRDLDAVSQRYAQSSLESEAQQTNMVLLTTATEPFAASSPKLILNLLAGIFLGGLAGIATALIRELRDPRVRDDSEVLHLSGVPLLARIGDAKMKDAKSNTPAAKQRLLLENMLPKRALGRRT